MAGENYYMQTVALVDDDRNILTSVSIALEAEGYRVETFTDGASALEGLMARPPSLAILDIKMPRMDGMELLRRLRQKTDLPVIFLTSKDDEIDEVLGLRMGADDYVKKPFSQRLLVERIRALLRRQEVAAGGALDGGVGEGGAADGGVAGHEAVGGEVGGPHVWPAAGGAPHGAWSACVPPTAAATGIPTLEDATT